MPTAAAGRYLRGMSQRPSRRAGFTLTDLLTCLALLALAAGAAGATYAHAVETANRVKCCGNLRQIGQALLLYSNENDNRYPRTVYAPAEPPTFGTPYAGDPDLGAAAKAVSPFDPKSPVRPKANDVTAALFLLLSTQDITPQAFVCPTTDQTPWNYGGGANSARNWVNWQGVEGIRRHLSYSFQTPYPSAEAVKNGFKFNNTVGSDFAVASDMNPGGEAVLKVAADSPVKEIRQANSGNHGGDGQCVLFGDGHVEFTQTPFVGPRGDNIFAYRKAAIPNGKADTNASAAGIVGSPFDGQDCLLLPTAEQVKLPRVDLTTRPADGGPFSRAEAARLADQADALAAESEATAAKARALAEQLRGD